MKRQEIEKAKRVAMAFVDRCNKLQIRLMEDHDHAIENALKNGEPVDKTVESDVPGCRESGEVRRMSMELSRQLSRMRK